MKHKTKHFHTNNGIERKWEKRLMELKNKVPVQVRTHLFEYNGCLYDDRAWEIKDGKLKPIFCAGHNVPQTPIRLESK